MGQPLEFEFKAKGDRETIAALEKIINGLKTSGDEAKKAGDKAEASTGSWKQLQQDFFYLRGNVQAVTGAIQAAIAGVQEMAAEFDRQARVLRAFSGDVNEASERTKGLISNIDLMVASNKAAAAGVQLSSHELANLAVKAVEVAQATGEDALSAFERLTEAVSKGEAEALRPYGIRLEGVTDKGEATRGALVQLEEQVGKTTAEVKGLSGALAQVETAMADAETAFIQGFDHAKGFGDGIDKVKEAIDRLGTALNLDLTPSMRQFVEIGVLVNEMLGAWARSYGEVIDAARELGRLDFTAALIDVQDAANIALDAIVSFATGRGDLASRVRAAMRTAPQAGTGAGKAPGAEEPAGPTAPKKLPDWLLREQAGSRGSANDNATLAPKGVDEAKFGAEKAELVARVEAQIRDIERERLATQTQLNDAKLAEVEASAKLVRKTQEQFNELNGVIQREEKRKELTEEQTSQIEEFGSIGAKAGELIAQAIEGNALGALDAFLKQKARENALLAVENTAKGIAAAIWAPQAAAGFFTAAAMHAGIAAGAGAGAAIVPGGGSGSAPVAAGGANRPVAETRAPSQSSGPSVINIYNAMGTPEEVGRSVYNAQRAAVRAGYIPKNAA